MLGASISEASPLALKRLLRVPQPALSCDLLEVSFPMVFGTTSCNGMRYQVFLNSDEPLNPRTRIYIPLI